MVNTLIGLNYWCVWKCYSNGVRENFLDIDEKLRTVYNNEVRGWGLRARVKVLSKKRQDLYTKKGENVNSEDYRDEKNGRLDYKSSLYYIKSIILKQLQINF